MTHPYTFEAATDDLLLLFSRAEAGFMPTPEHTATLLAARTQGGMDEIVRWIAAHPKQAAGAQAGYQAAADHLGGLTSVYLALAARLLEWSSTRTGLTHTEVVAKVLAHTDLDTED